MPTGQLTDREWLLGEHLNGLEFPVFLLGIKILVSSLLEQVLHTVCIPGVPIYHYTWGHKQLHS